MLLKDYDNTERLRPGLLRSAVDLIALLSVFYLWMLSQSVLASELKGVNTHTISWMSSEQPVIRKDTIVRRGPLTYVNKPGLVP